MFKVVLVIAVLASPMAAYAQGSAGTGSTSTGLGEPTGPGIRRGGWTQQPSVATNPVRGPTNLTPSQKNSIPPPNARPTNAQRYPK
jgi:hypothetical protein